MAEDIPHSNPYIRDMEIVWDEPKRQANLAKHGMDFVDLDLRFFEEAVIGPAKNGRRLAVGRLGGIVTVVFVHLGTEGISVISMRPGSARERKNHGETL